MATWNGSYPEDLNYLVYTDRNAVDATAGNWQYFTGNTAYLRDVPTGSYYPGTRNGRHVYEQTGSTATFYQLGAQHSSNMVPLENNAYQEHVLPNVSSANSMRASKDIASMSCNTPPFSHGGYKARSRGNRAAGKHVPPPPTSDIIQSTVVENSNLHPMANEFVPNNQAKFRRDPRRDFRRYDNGNAMGSGFNAGAQEFRTKSADKSFLSNNRYKNERRSDNRRDANYRQRKPQDAQVLQAPRSGYRDTQKTYNPRSYNKFQNGRYYNNKKYQLDTEKYATSEAHIPVTETIDSVVSSNQENKAAIEEIQENENSFSNTKISRSGEETSLHEDNDSENMPSRIETQRNGRLKRVTNAFNYRYNSDDMQAEPGARRKTIPTAAKYTQRRNNEVPNYKEKKVENWRDRTESNEMTQAPQGKNPKKRFDIGIFIKSIKEIALLYKRDIVINCYFVYSYQMMTRVRGKD